MEIDGDAVDDGSAFFIAEAGVNHGGDLALAEELVDVAAEAGADAVKFQTFDPERLVASGASKATYQDERVDGSQREMLERYELGPADHEALQAYCERRGITFLSTPFDAGSAALLDDLGVPAFKVGSGELTNHPLLGTLARYGRPMVVSTGMATMPEVAAAYDAIREANPDVPVCLLHCVSAYPTDPDAVNFGAMDALAERFPVPVGFSDHTTAVETPALAVAAGAAVVEKHVTLDRSLPGPDHEASLEPDELARSVALVRRAAAMAGPPEKEPVPVEAEVRTVARKSLHAARDLERGETITDDAVAILRPATGLPPAAHDAVVGERTTTDLRRHDPITEDAVAGTTPAEDAVAGDSTPDLAADGRPEER